MHGQGKFELAFPLSALTEGTALLQEGGRNQNTVTPPSGRR